VADGLLADESCLQGNEPKSFICGVGGRARTLGCVFFFWVEGGWGGGTLVGGGGGGLGLFISFWAFFGLDGLGGTVVVQEGGGRGGPSLCMRDITATEDVFALFSPSPWFSLQSTDPELAGYARFLPPGGNAR